RRLPHLPTLGRGRADVPEHRHRVPAEGNHLREACGGEEVEPPLIPAPGSDLRSARAQATAGIQFFLCLTLGPRFRGDERIVCPRTAPRIRAATPCRPPASSPYGRDR